MPAPRKVSLQQMEIMITFLEDRRALAKGQVDNTPQAKAAAKRLWDELASLLNRQGMGISKTGSQWREYWRDLKYRVRLKAGEKEVDSRRTRGGPASSVGLPALEKRICSIISDRSEAGDVSVRIPFDLAEVPPTPDGPAPPSPATEMEVHSVSSDASLSSYGPPYSPAQSQESTSTAPPVHESPSAADIPVSQAPAAKKQKTTGKSTPVEIPQPRWAWEAERRRLDVDERRLKVEERRVALEERAMVHEERMASALEAATAMQERTASVLEAVMAMQERMASALEAIAGDTAAIRQRL